MAKPPPTFIVFSVSAFLFLFAEGVTKLTWMNTDDSWPLLSAGAGVVYALVMLWGWPAIYGLSMAGLAWGFLNHPPLAFAHLLEGFAAALLCRKFAIEPEPAPMLLLAGLVGVIGAMIAAPHTTLDFFSIWLSELLGIGLVAPLILAWHKKLVGEEEGIFPEQFSIFFFMPLGAILLLSVYSPLGFISPLAVSFFLIWASMRFPIHILLLGTFFTLGLWLNNGIVSPLTSIPDQVAATFLLLTLYLVHSRSCDLTDKWTLAATSLAETRKESHQQKARLNELDAILADLEDTHTGDSLLIDDLQDRWEGIFTNDFTAISLSDLETGRILEVNSTWEAMYGYRAEEASRITLESIKATQDASDDPDAPVQHRTRNGETIPVEEYTTVIDHGERPRLLCISREITGDIARQHALDHSQRNFENLIDHIPGMVFRCKHDQNHTLEFISNHCHRLLSCEPERLIGLPFLQNLRLIHPEDRNKIRTTLKQTAQSGSPMEVECRVFGKNFEEKWVAIRVWGGLDHSESDDEGYAVEGYILDLTEQKLLEMRSSHILQHDPLTGLPNRQLLQDHIHKTILLALGQDHRAALLHIGLQRFQAINDHLGHTIGDELLKAVADRLRTNARTGDTVARVSGSEFALLVAEVKDLPRLMGLAERILQTMSEPYQIWEHSLLIHPQMGISIYPDDGKDAPILMRSATIALHHVRISGDLGYQFYTKEMGTETQTLLALEANLRQALLQNKELELFYQPVADLNQGKIISVEALVRWRHPRLGLIPPGRFIPMAEDSELILPLGRFALNRALMDLDTLHQEGHEDLSIAVNFSARQLHQERFVEDILQAIQLHNMPADKLTIEVTEGAVMHNPEDAVRNLARIHQMGIKIAIDDFGTGHSSLAYLKRFSVDHLKIDRTFIVDTPKNEEDCAIVSTIIMLAHNLGLHIIAEGVEKHDQLRFLMERGCANIQGFLIARPMPLDELKIFLNEFNPKFFSPHKGFDENTEEG